MYLGHGLDFSRSRDVVDHNISRQIFLEVEHDQRLDAK